MVGKDKVKAKTFLQQVSILLSKKNERIFSIANAFFTKRKAIILESIPRKKSQKTSIGFGNLHVNNCS